MNLWMPFFIILKLVNNTTKRNLKDDYGVKIIIYCEIVSNSKCLVVKTK